MQPPPFPGLIVSMKARGYRAMAVLDARTRVARTRWGASVVRSATRALDALVALPAGRLRAALYGLLLLEAYVVVTIVLTVLGDLASASPLGSDSAPDPSGLVFLATILLPALLYSGRRVQKEATDRRAYDASVREEAHRLRQPTLEGAYHALYLRADAPLHVAEAAYIAAMKRAHPDVHGGSNEQATRLTQAIEIIRATDRTYQR